MTVPGSLQTASMYALYRRTLSEVTELVSRVGDDGFDRRTPCTEWNVGQLLAHMIGQNVGFAAAVGSGDAPEASYRWPDLTAAGAQAQWQQSADRLLAAFAAADPDAAVVLREFPPGRQQFRASQVLGIHLLDTAVHCWDLATALGEGYRPDEAVVRIVAEQARMIGGSGAANPVFDPARPTDRTDPWAVALALLGREPGGPTIS
jgi:uncharacterized protein (TIGR03086 family)